MSMREVFIEAGGLEGGGGLGVWGRDVTENEEFNPPYFHNYKKRRKEGKIKLILIHNDTGSFPGKKVMIHYE